MQFLITGGAGFIGIHLANTLAAKGGFVRVLDDMSSGDPAALAPGIHFTRGDVRDTWYFLMILRTRSARELAE